MLTLCDAQGRFMAVDIGASGRQSDSGLYTSWPLRRYLESSEAGIPAAEPLEGVGLVPYVVVADGGFGLRDYMITPSTDPSTISEDRLLYNTVLSAARHVVESAFGQLVQ